jgi:hypothetical protein
MMDGPEQKKKGLNSSSKMEEKASQGNCKLLPRFLRGLKCQKK